MTHGKFTIVAPKTPGVTPSVVGTADTEADAWRVAVEFTRGRPDLRGQDVRIEYRGRRICYGPGR